MSGKHRESEKWGIAGIALFAAVAVAAVTIYAWSSSTIEHAGERYDKVLGEYVVAPPFSMLSDPGPGIREAGDAILDWYMSLERNYQSSEREDRIEEQLTAAGYADSIAADGLFTMRVADYLYGTRWLKEYNEMMSERYREKGAEWTPVTREISGGHP